MVSAIILAAGLSSRMGGSNKLLLPYGDEAIVRRVVNRIVDASPGEVIVVLGHEATAVEAALNGLPLKFCPNESYLDGMTSSISAGVGCAMEAGYMMCLSDMYAITTAEYRQIIEAFEHRYLHDHQCICIPRYQGRQGNPVVFSNAYRELIIHHREPNGCRAIVKQYADHVKWVEMEFPHVLQDIDSPQDYSALRDMT